MMLFMIFLVSVYDCVSNPIVSGTQLTKNCI